MIKPDYIPFSQEIFDEINEMRIRVMSDPTYKLSSEFKRKAFQYFKEVMTDEYNRFITEQMNAASS